MTPMREEHWGQAEPLLRQLSDAKAVGHAYLLAGPAGSSKESAAWHIARIAACSAGGCGTCEDCSRIANHLHPDVHYITPQSSQGYLVAQIRELINDIQLSPVRTARKVYILSDAQKLNPNSANALLKSLEEPPTDTVFILLATSAQAVLPTIASRCQTIQFPPLSKSESVRRLALTTGASEHECKRILSFCTDLGHAESFLASNQKRQARTISLDVIASLRELDELDLMHRAASMVDAVKACLEELEGRQEEEARELSDILGGPALKELSERHKRERAAAERSGIIECLSAQRALLHDCMKTCVDPTHVAECDDYATAVTSVSRHLGTDGSLRAIQIVSRAIRRIESNVTPRMAVEAMLLELKEIRPCQP